MWIRRSAWGLDLTGGSLKAVRVERRGGRFRVVEALDLPYATAGQGGQKPSIRVPREADALIQRFVSEREDGLQMPVFVGVHGYGSRQGQIQLPDVEPERIEDFLDVELEQALEGRAGWVVRTSERPRGRRRGARVGFHAQERKVLDPFLADLQRSELPVDGLLPEGLALARSLHLEWGGQDRRLAIQIQRTRTDLLFVTPKGLRFRSMPFGVGGLTGFAAGSRTPPQQEVRGLAQRLANELHRAELHFFGGRGNFSAERVLLLGEGAGLPTLVNALSQVLRCEVGVLHSIRKMALGESLRGGVALDVAQMGTALGLALAGLDRKGDPFNLIEPPPERRTRRRRPLLISAALAATVALLALHVQASAEVGRLRELQGEADHHEDWARQERLVATMARGSASVRERLDLLWKVTALRRQTEYPYRILSETTEPSVYFRLEDLRVDGGRESDRVVLVVSVPKGITGLEEPVRSVEDWARDQLPLTVEEVSLRSENPKSWSVQIQGTTPDPRS